MQYLYPKVSRDWNENITPMLLASIRGDAKAVQFFSENDCHLVKPLVSHDPWAAFSGVSSD